MPATDHASQELARLICAAHASHQMLDEVPAELALESVTQAYSVQRELLRQRHEQPGGWKVGAKAPGAQPQGAALPASGVMASPAVLSRQSLAPCGIELEIAFYFNRDFVPTGTPYSHAEVMGSICRMAAAVELVASRFSRWPAVDKVWQLADLQNHGALILGEARPYQGDFPFASPQVRLSYNGVAIAAGVGANPAGDPRKLLPWLVNHCMAQGYALMAGIPVTTGSYTGMYFPTANGVVDARIAGLPPIELGLV